MDPRPRGRSSRRARDKRELDLRSLLRRLALHFQDAITTAIQAILLDRAHTHTPRVSLRLLSEAAVDTLDLRHGHIDLEVGSTVTDVAKIQSETMPRTGSSWRALAWLGGDGSEDVRRCEAPLDAGVDDVRTETGVALCSGLELIRVPLAVDCRT